MSFSSLKRSREKEENRHTVLHKQAHINATLLLHCSMIKQCQRYFFICCTAFPFFHFSSGNSLVCQWPPLCISFSPLLCLTGPPSAPRNVISSINETSVILDWSWPEDSGGRRDITFTVLCKRCRGVTGNGSSGGTQTCEPCRSNVRFLPRSAGLQNTTVTVADLLAHTNYTFEIEAQNGVSPLAPKMRQYAAVTITTNQAGETSQEAGRWIKAITQIIRQK